EDEEGIIDRLNPNIKDEDSEKSHRDNPRVFSHVLEQNYLKRNDDNSVDLAGVSVGISLKSVYRFEADGKGPYYENISTKRMLKYGKEIADEVLEEMREIEGLENVPIMIALFREEEQSSPVPGHFV